MIDDTETPVIIDLGEIEVGERSTVRFVRTDPHLDPANVVLFSFHQSSNNPGMPSDFSTAGIPDAEISFEIDVTEPGPGYAGVEVACAERVAEIHGDLYEIHFEGVNDATRAAAAAEAQRQADAERRARDLAARRAAAAPAADAHAPAAPARSLPSWLIALIVVVIAAALLGIAWMTYNAVQAPARAIMNAGKTTEVDDTDKAPNRHDDDGDNENDHSYFADPGPRHISANDTVEIGPDGRTYIRHGCCNKDKSPTIPSPPPVALAPTTIPCRSGTGLPICP
ncbi:hypothetical protein KJ910_02260 [Patescibacteria group bacterium]|nr:hypothetical protein [Patescibacteria group bacterium]MBU1907405.1 hypothetical protein [Patescibacteria group bacterium]